MARARLLASLCFCALLAAAAAARADSIVFFEDFNGVTSLPGGWSSTSTGGVESHPWVIRAVPFDGNELYTPNVNRVATSALFSPTILLPDGGPSTLSFDNRIFTDATDGGVLDISINGGAFQDIIAAGASFVTGGYNMTLSTAFSSPIGGRQAWSGTFPYFLTQVILPALAVGQDVQFEWLLANDNLVSPLPGFSGWQIDNVAVTSPVPEPASLTLLGTGLFAAWRARHRRLPQTLNGVLSKLRPQR